MSIIIGSGICNKFMVLVLEGSTGGECTSTNHALATVAVDADEVPSATHEGRTLDETEALVEF